MPRAPAAAQRRPPGRPASTRSRRPRARAVPAGSVSASRSIADAAGRGGPGSPRDAARAKAERLREQAWALV